MSLNQGLCQCGCGKPTNISPVSHAARGLVKGQPMRFVRGHRSKNPDDVIRRSPYRTKNSQLLHILIAEKALGKPLPPGAQVHHVDGNTLNNAPSNLVICQDQAYHTLLHIRQRVLAAGGDPNTQRICSGCKRLTKFADLTSSFIRQNTSQCRKCHNDSQMRRYRERRARAGFDVSKVRIRVTEPEQLPLSDQWSVGA